MYYLIEIDNDNVKILFSDERLVVVKSKLQELIVKFDADSTTGDMTRVYKKKVSKGWIYNGIEMIHKKTYYIADHKMESHPPKMPIVIPPVKLKHVKRVVKKRQKGIEKGSVLFNVHEALNKNELFKKIRDSVKFDEDSDD